MTKEWHRTTPSLRTPHRPSGSGPILSINQTTVQARDSSSTEPAATAAWSPPHGRGGGRHYVPYDTSASTYIIGRISKVWALAVLPGMPIAHSFAKPVTESWFKSVSICENPELRGSKAADGELLASGNSGERGRWKSMVKTFVCGCFGKCWASNTQFATLAVLDERYKMSVWLFGGAWCPHCARGSNLPTPPSIAIFSICKLHGRLFGPELLYYT